MEKRLGQVLTLESTVWEKQQNTILLSVLWQMQGRREPLIQFQTE
jgi:hypothetical protein